MDSKFAHARDTYRAQVLDAIRILTAPHPFSAVTLACCAVDLLSHTVYEPTYADRERAFKETVARRLAGYGDEDVPDAIYELRCGLVHEYRTKGAMHLAITAEGVGAPTRENGVLIVSVQHFCDAVCRAFEKLFQTQDVRQRRSFVDRAFIYVMTFPGETLRFSAPVDHISQTFQDTYTGTPLASGTGGPFPPPMSDNELPWRDP